jgi:hypothetical protein
VGEPPSDQGRSSEHRGSRSARALSASRHHTHGPRLPSCNGRKPHRHGSTRQLPAMPRLALGGWLSGSIALPRCASSGSWCVPHRHARPSSGRLWTAPNDGAVSDAKTWGCSATCSGTPLRPPGAFGAAADQPADRRPPHRPPQDAPQGRGRRTRAHHPMGPGLGSHHTALSTRRTTQETDGSPSLENSP